MGFHKITLPPETFWKGDVIGVHNCDVPALSEKTARVASGAQSTVGYLVDLDSFVLDCIALSDGFRFVRRPEVDDDKFKVRQGLAEYAFDRLGKKIVDVTCHHNHGNKWGIHRYEVVVRHVSHHEWVPTTAGPWAFSSSRENPSSGQPYLPR